jgi:large subunit ribosomal protein L6
MTATAKQEVTKQSRNGKLPVALLPGVSVEINGQEVTVTGKRGSLTRTFRPEVVVSQEDGNLLVRPAPGVGQVGLQFQGLSRALVANMVEGVTNGFVRSLDFRGVGYRAEFGNGELKMTVGLSHQPVIKIPEEVTVKIEQRDEAGVKYPRVHIEASSKELVGQIAAHIRSKRPAEPYNGKGVRYVGEQIRQKAGKSGKK